jgi:UDP-N-acetyl-D-glucosamine dehydrogenase
MTRIGVAGFGVIAQSSLKSHENTPTVGMLGNALWTVRITHMSAQNSQVLAIIGQGYVGLPLAMAAVDAGWTVVGIDNFEAKVSQINAGSSPVEDISDQQLRAALAKGVYKATTDFSAVAGASVITICVPTPLDEKREPDLALLRSAAQGIAPFVSNETLVVSESTSYPGTLRDVIIPIVNQLKPQESQNLYFASAPERVNPGDPVWNQKNTPRLVGAIDAASKTKALGFYESICDAAVSVSTPEIAEAAKLLENTFRLVNIALINEFTQLCSANNINVHEVIDAASSKPYGFMPFRPGVGVGGHCIPVDPLYLTWWARKGGQVASLVERSDEISNSMPKYVAERALALIKNSTSSPKVLILGVAYKPGVGDVRETPASALRAALVAKGVEVAWIDPLVQLWEGTKPVNESWSCDVAIVATNQPGLDVNSLIANQIPILDCTNNYGNLAGVELL